MSKKSNKTQSEYITNDISVAAFLMMKGLTLTKASNAGGRYEFIFDDPQNEALNLVLSFPGTPFGQYDSYLRMLRGLVKSK